MRTDRFRRRVRELERRVLRGPRPGPGTAGIMAALSDSDADAELRGWVLLLEQTVAPLVEALASERLLLVDAIRAHVAAAEALAANEDGDGAQRLWTGDDGEAAAAAIDDLLAAAADIPAIPGAEYPDLFAALCAGRVVRPRYGRHPRLAIWGLLEARLQRADVMILGGLNEGTWPPDPDADPWLSHGMRRTLGLPTPERRIGLTAHDFVQAASGGNVVLTRAEKVDGTPTVPSRWLLRIDAVLGAAREALRPTSPWLDWQEALDRTSAAPRPVAPPAPRPPVEARPRRLSVTAVETWIRDPYSIYARRILGLAPLDPIDADPGAADRGVFIHDSLDRFLREVGTELPPDSLDRLHAIGRNLLGDALARPGVWAFWWPRFERIAAWFVDAVGRRLAEGSVVSLTSETRGSIELQGPAGPFTLVAKADRIDTLGEGALEIVDYKTGAMPSRRLVDLGVAPQLALEAAIARRGGFEGVAAAPVAALTYWRLVGNTTGGEIRAAGSHAAAALADDAERGLARLVAVFDDPATAYRSRPRPRYAPRFSDYDHLARVAEWSADFDDGDA
jgi:ATP-dependent helicase/nuclease subunit B